MSGDRTQQMACPPDPLPSGSNTRVYRREFDTIGPRRRAAPLTCVGFGLPAATSSHYPRERDASGRGAGTGPRYLPVK